MKINENNPTETTVTANVTLSLDLGDRKHSCCVLDAEGDRRNLVLRTIFGLVMVLLGGVQEIAA